MSLFRSKIVAGLRQMCKNLVLRHKGRRTERIERICGHVGTGRVVAPGEFPVELLRFCVLKMVLSSLSRLGVCFLTSVLRTRNMEWNLDMFATVPPAVQKWLDEETTGKEKGRRHLSCVRVFSFVRRFSVHNRKELITAVFMVLFRRFFCS